jgi:hypothetical protein
MLVESSRVPAIWRLETGSRITTAGWNLFDQLVHLREVHLEPCIVGT